MPHISHPPTTSLTYDAFACIGIELEYMAVDSSNYQPLGVVDELFKLGAQEIKDQQHTTEPIDELDFGPIGWSNELARHVLELKTATPAKSWDNLVSQFQNEIERANRLLHHCHGTLLPGGVHPWMDPSTQAQLWPHGQSEIYLAYDRIFNCSGHGWLNVQSMHINLPFRGDDQFRRLHSATRLVLPVVVALSASSPVLDGKLSGAVSERMRRYANNQRKIPEISGEIIPEVIQSISAYHDKILSPMYQAIAPFDPDGVLQHEWLNSRGAIARFDRNAIEIRVADTQECPQADLGLAYLTNAWIRDIYEERYCSLKTQESFAVGTLAAQLQECVVKGGGAKILDPGWARALGGTGEELRVEELIRVATKRVLRSSCPTSLRDALSSFEERPGLSSRMLSYVDHACSRASLANLCASMSRSLANGCFLEPRAC